MGGIGRQRMFDGIFNKLLLSSTKMLSMFLKKTLEKKISQNSMNSELE